MPVGSSILPGLPLCCIYKSKFNIRRLDSVLRTINSLLSRRIARATRRSSHSAWNDPRTASVIFAKTVRPLERRPCDRRSAIGAARQRTRTTPPRSRGGRQLSSFFESQYSCCTDAPCAARATRSNGATASARFIASAQALRRDVAARTQTCRDCRLPLKMLVGAGARPAPISREGEP